MCSFAKKAKLIINRSIRNCAWPCIVYMNTGHDFSKVTAD